MKRFLWASFFCLVLSLAASAQQSDADAPASREDIQRYLTVMHSHEMMQRVAAAMAKPMQKMVHDQYLKDKNRLPSDFEASMSKNIDDMFLKMPWDEMLDATIPVYQKYLTKGDVASLIAFYTSPTGKKMLNQMPAMMSDSMEAMMPILRQHIDEMQDNVQQQMAEMLRKAPAAQQSAPVKN